jgi:hypothetical protein
LKKLRDWVGNEKKSAGKRERERSWAENSKRRSNDKEKEREISG